MKWCGENHQQLNVAKTKEIMVDFRKKAPPSPVCSSGSDMIIKFYKYLDIHLDDNLEWSTNTKANYRKGVSRLYFLRRFRSFNVCTKMLHMFSQSVVSSTICCVVLGRRHHSKGRQQTE